MKIGDIDRPIHGNINGLIELKNDYKVDIITFDKAAFSFEIVRALAFVALKYGAKKEKQPFELTLEDVGDLITLPDMQRVMSECMKCFVGDIVPKEGEGTGESVGASSEKSPSGV